MVEQRVPGIISMSPVISSLKSMNLTRASLEKASISVKLDIFENFTTFTSTGLFMLPNTFLFCSATAVGIGPDEEKKLEKITGKLKLL